jgi:hypothetical protein
MGEDDGAHTTSKGFFPNGMRETVLKNTDGHIGVKGGLDFKVIGDAVDTQKNIAGTEAEFLIDGFSTKVFDLAVQGVFGVEETVDEGDNSPVGEVEELLEGSIKNLDGGTFWPPAMNRLFDLLLGRHDLS